VNRTFVLKKVENFGGKAASIYTIKFFDKKINELEDFVRTHKEQHHAEVTEIMATINAISFKFGAREHFFKEWEGRPGDGVCALYDTIGSKLRMYCIRYGRVAVVLGNGGFKPKTIRSLQEDPHLTATNAVVREISRLIDARFRSKEIWWEGNDLGGNLEFNFEDDEDE
jgi:hypothetical protein